MEASCHADRPGANVYSLLGMLSPSLKYALDKRKRGFTKVVRLREHIVVNFDIMYWMLLHNVAAHNVYVTEDKHYKTLLHTT